MIEFGRCACRSSEIYGLDKDLKYGDQGSGMDKPCDAEVLGRMEITLYYD
jgi:hypothetical protein